MTRGIFHRRKFSSANIKSKTSVLLTTPISDTRTCLSKFFYSTFFRNVFFSFLLFFSVSLTILGPICNRAHEQGGMLEHNLAERPTVLSCYYTTIYYSCSAPAQNGYKSLLGKSYYHKYFTYKAVYINYNHIPFPVLSLSLALA